MKTTINLRGADLAVGGMTVYVLSDKPYVYLNLNDCEGGALQLRVDRQTAIDIIASLQKSVDESSR